MRIYDFYTLRIKEEHLNDDFSAQGSPKKADFCPKKASGVN